MKTTAKQIRNLKFGDMIDLGEGPRGVEYVFTADGMTTIHLMNGQVVTLPSRTRIGG